MQGGRPKVVVVALRWIAFRSVVQALPEEGAAALTLSATELKELVTDIEAIGTMPILSGPEDDLTVAQLASALGKSQSSVRAQMPKVPGAYRYAGREWRVPREAWQRYREENASSRSAPERIRLHSSASIVHPQREVRLRPPLRGDELERAQAG